MPRTATNSEGKPVIPLSDEERYIFDTKGWLAIPGVLDESEMTEMREFCCKLKFEQETVPERDRSTISGPLETLCDHPRVVGFMQEFCGSDDMESDEGYGFRMEYSFMGMRLRKYKNDSYSPHGGRGAGLKADGWHVYRGLPGQAFSGLTQAVWELNPVVKGDGTLFLSGSHKGHFDLPDAIRGDREHFMWETYECAAGSIVFFTETLTHSGNKWKNDDHDRMAIFNSYNAIPCRYHYWDPHPDQLADMHPKRQSLFRYVANEWNLVGMEVPDDVFTPRRGF
jgi:hypothetical protein